MRFWKAWKDWMGPQKVPVGHSGPELVLGGSSEALEVPDGASGSKNKASGVLGWAYERLGLGIRDGNHKVV